MKSSKLEFNMIEGLLVLVFVMSCNILGFLILELWISMDISFDINFCLRVSGL